VSEQVASLGAARTAHSAAAAAAGAVVCVAVAIAVSAAGAAAFANHSPIVPPGHWHVALQASLVAGFAAYVVGVLALRRAHVDAKLVLAVAVVVQLLPLFGPVLLSTDVASYFGYAHLAAFEHRNPYVLSPDNQISTVYGPLFTLLSEGVSLATGGAAHAAELVLRALAAAAVLGTAWLASRLARDAALALALVGWNPLLALHFGGGGHNDALFVALILGALLLERRRGPARGAALWSASVFVKWVSLALAPIHLAASLRRDGGRHAGRFAIALAVSLAAFAALASLRYGVSWIDAARTISHVGRRTGSIGPGHWIDGLGLSSSTRDHAITASQLLVILALTAWAARTGHARLGLGGALLAATQGWLNPWYAIWGVGLAAADERDRAGRILAVVLSAYLMLDASTW
jgi:hypothetical protein